VRYACPEGQQLIGPEVRICQADGRWSGQAPECRFHECGPLPGESPFWPKIGQNLIQKVEMTYGTILKKLFQCQKHSEVNFMITIFYIFVYFQRKIGIKTML
jgi:hypothetical protein